MRKTISVIFFISILLALSNCTSYLPNSTQKDPVITQHFSFSDIDTVESNLSIPVVLRTASEPEIYISTPQSLQKNVMIQQRQKTLYLSNTLNTSKNTNDAIQVVLYLPPTVNVLKQTGTGNILSSQSQFHRLNITTTPGDGNIDFKDAKIGALTINHASSSHIHLTGEINVEHIQQKGLGSINISWVNSSELHIESQGGIISLAGTVGRVDAVLTGHAFLDAKYLRANQTHINTQGDAIAHIQTSDSQNLRAGENSSIYFYKDPQHQAQAATDHGSIIRTSGLGKVPTPDV